MACFPGLVILTGEGDRRRDSIWPPANFAEDMLEPMAPSRNVHAPLEPFTPEAVYSCLLLKSFTSHFADKTLGTIRRKRVIEGIEGKFGKFKGVNVPTYVSTCHPVQAYVGTWPPLQRGGDT